MAKDGRMKMNRIAAIVFAGCLAGLAVAESIPALVPWPQKVTLAGPAERMTMGRIMAQSAALEPLARVLAGEIYLSTAVRVPVAIGPGGPGDIALRMSDSVKADEGYRLTVGASGITVEGRTYRGVAWGTVTLLQSMESKEGALLIPRFTVEDQPVASYRGLLIDVGRQWHPVEAMRPLIEMCRLYKINYMQLHLNDNTEGNVMAFPSKAFPQLATERRGKPTTYTLEEITGLVKYADERGVTLVPEVSGPGAHAGPLRTVWGRGNTIDVWNEKTYEGLAVLFGEVAAVFKSSPYIHLGGDEGSFGHLGKTPEENAFREKNGIKTGPLNYYLSRMDAIVKKNGKKTICWEGFGGDGGGLPKDIVVMPYESQFNPADKLVKHGFSVINTAWKPLYVVGGRKWDPAYIYDSWNMWLWEHHVNTRCHIQLKEADPVIGAQICAWEQRAEVELPSTRARVPVLSERTWNPALGKAYADYLPRAARADALLDRVLAMISLRADGLTGEQEGGYEFFVKPVTITMSAPPIGRIRYTVDGKEPDGQSREYKGPITIGEADTHSEKLFYNRRMGRHMAEGYTCTLNARLFDEKGNAMGDVTTSRNFWYKGAEIVVKEEGLSGEKEGDVEKFKGPLTVSLSAAGPGTIRYTLNGKDPAAADAAYAKPLLLTQKDCKVQGILFSRASKRFDKQAPVVIVRAKLFGADGKALPGLTLQRTYWYTGTDIVK